jgi:isopenicillin-N epimerase
MIDLNLRDLEADFYTGNCHKWLCAPKGAGFLHVHPEHRPIIRPLAISHGANATRQDRSRFTMEFDWTGTADPTAWLCVGTAIKWMAGQMPGGWKAIMQRNHTLVTQASEQLQSRLGYRCLAPDSMLGAMASVQIPDTNMPIPESTPLYSDSLQDKLWSEHQIEVPIVPWPHHPRRLLRISAQLYNQSSDYQKLIEVLERHGPKPQ